jgi:hypothetical protein
VPPTFPPPPPGPSRLPAGDGRRIAWLLSVGAGFGALTAVLGSRPAVLALTACLAAVGAAAAVGLRAQWRAADPGSCPGAAEAPVPPAAPAGDEVAARLRQLHSRHVQEVDAALDAGRADLVHQLAERYTDRALAVLTDVSAAGPGPVSGSPPR